MGWYAIATSRDVKAREIRTVRYFGRELILYRTESGEAHVTDAYCPHLGAHLGRGTVDGDNLRCPFHGFEFGNDGRCVRTAYGKAAPRKARLTHWPVREHNGYIFAWYHPAREQPDWEIPVMPGADEGWTPFRTRSLSVRSHPQETSENSVDVGHFVQVHGFGDAWCESDLEVEGHLLKSAYGIRYRLAGDLLAVIARFDVRVHGLGYSHVHVRIPRFGAAVNLLVMSTPIDHESIVLRTGASARAWGVLPATLLLREFGSISLNREIEQDAPIWETKQYVARPALADGDGPIGAYRRYCRQFYPPSAGPDRQVLVSRGTR